MKRREPLYYHIVAQGLQRCGAKLELSLLARMFLFPLASAINGAVLSMHDPASSNDKGLLVATAKTNAVRLLDRLGIRYELRSYDVDPDDLAAETVAQKIGMSPEQVFKTLVARGDKHGVCLAVVPGNCELDLKAWQRRRR